MILDLLIEKEIGWARDVIKNLREYALETDQNKIKTKTRGKWKKEVREAIENKNIETLKLQCRKVENGVTVDKTKTKFVLEQISDKNYKRKPMGQTLKNDKNTTKALILARFGMIECGKNFRNKITQTCPQCETLDDEDHRLNFCIKWRDINFYDESEKVPFGEIYSCEEEKLKEMISRIKKVWNVEVENGQMRG